MDKGGQWSFKKTVKGQHAQLIFKTLAKFEGYTLEQARQSGMAEYNMSQCPNQQATTRLANQYQGQDSLCRFEVSGNGKSQKLFGIRDGSTISLIWYDTNHTVWPSGS